MSASSIPHFAGTDHEFKPCTSKGQRSPCPALNALANHGYISRTGQDLTFLEIVRAIVFVYNLSYPLALVLTFAGFITCGQVSFLRPPSSNMSQTCTSYFSWVLWLLVPFYNLALRFAPRFILHLSSLSRRGNFKIAHDASFVHPDALPSESPDLALVEELLNYALATRDLDGKPRDGLGLIDIARFHAQRIESAPAPLSGIHLQIALGECALTWDVLRGHQYHSECDEHDPPSCTLKGRVDGVVPISRLNQWFGQERLPDGWWDVNGVRPQKSIGIIRTRMLANLIGILGARGSYTKYQ